MPKLADLDYEPVMIIAGRWVQGHHLRLRPYGGSNGLCLPRRTIRLTSGVDILGVH